MKPVKIGPVSALAFWMSCLLLAGCGGYWKPDYSTSVNASTFPQPQVPAAPTESPAELPPPVAENSAFLIVDGIPQYRIGPGDVLDLTITRGSAQDKLQATVRSNGKIFVLLTEVNVTGLTTDQASAAITHALTDYLRHPWVDVQVKEFNSKKVTVFGSVGSVVRASGTSIPLTGRMTIVEAIGKAGGFNPNASMNKVRLVRADGKAYVVNLFQLMQDGDPKLQFVLDSGDAVFVPEQVKGEERRVFLLGEVKQPGPVPYFPNLTMGQLIAQVGGWTDGALYDQAAIVRATPEVTEIYTVDLRRLLLEGDKRIDQYLKPNDVVFVPRTPIASWNALVNQLLPTFTLINTPLQSVLSIEAISNFTK